MERIHTRTNTRAPSTVSLVLTSCAGPSGRRLTVCKANARKRRFIERNDLLRRALFRDADVRAGEIGHRTAALIAREHGDLHDHGSRAKWLARRRRFGALRQRRAGEREYAEGNGEDGDRWPGHGGIVAARCQLSAISSQTSANSFTSTGSTSPVSSLQCREPRTPNPESRIPRSRHCLKAVTGSMWTARRAGIAVAASATSVSRVTTTAKVRGSRVVTPWT